MKNPFLLLRILPIATVLLLTAGISYAQVLLSVDFNAGTSPSPTQPGFTGTTAGVATNTGPFTTSFSGLGTTYTVAGTVGLTMTFPVTTGNYTTRERTGTAANTGSFTYNALYRDLWISSNNGGDLVYNFTGLLPNEEYEIRFYAYDQAATGSRTMTFTDWTAGSAGTGSHTGSVTYTSGSTFTGAAGDNYLYSTLISVTSDASGNLVIRETTGGSYASVVNGFELIAVPEPSAVALFGASFGFLVLFRKRRTVV